MNEELPDYSAPTTPDNDAAMDEAKRDAEAHVAYFKTLTRALLDQKDALAMTIAYIQSKNIAKLSVELPPEEQEGWQG